MQEQPGASATTSDAVDEPLSEAPAAAPSIEVSTPEVLITEEEVVFSTTAAVTPSVNGPATDSSPAYGERWRDGRTHHTGIRTPRRTTSSAPACPVKSTAYERSDKASARLYS